MALTYRAESRKEWSRSGDLVYDNDLQIGCLQRIADATELMAKRYQELIDQKERAETLRDYWQDAHDRMARRLIAARGQITKWKRKATGTTHD
jgi:hypothetical protein